MESLTIKWQNFEMEKENTNGNNSKKDDFIKRNQQKR